MTTPQRQGHDLALTGPRATGSLTAHMPHCIVPVMHIALPMLGAVNVRSGGGS